MKAMILAAGLGARLQPLTLTTPKPLIFVGQHRLIEYHLYRLAALGITEVVINIFHHQNQFPEILGNGSRYGIKIHYSIEETLLGTGGGIYQALPILGNAPFIVLSGDIWTDFPLGKWLKSSINSTHLVLVDNPRYHEKGDFGLANDGSLTAIHPFYTYASFGILHPNLFTGVTKKCFGLAELFHLAVASGQISGEKYSGAWFNVGTLEELTALQNYLTTISK